MDFASLHHRFGPMLSPLLAPLGKSYAFAMARRRALYSQGTMKGYRSTCPTVSVGNIAAGGTGKTPLTSWLLSWAAANSVHACVLTRGYGGHTGPKPVLVGPETSAQVCGDEPLSLYRKHPKASIIAFPKRSAAAKQAEESLAPDLFVLDDGMQHLAMQRDADFVILRPEDLGNEWGKVIPYGIWREGPSALHAATIFLIKADDAQLAALAPQAEKHLTKMGKPLYAFTLTPTSCRTLHPTPATGSFSATCHLQREGYVLVTGVGNPWQVAATAKQFVGQEPWMHQMYPDHHNFTAQDAAEIAAMGKPVLCTEKDAVKLQNIFGPDAPVFVMQVEVCFGDALFTNVPFEQWWANWWARSRAARGGE